MRLVWGTVTAAGSGAEGAQELTVEVDGASAARAVTYPEMTGECVPGDRVLLNTTAVDLSLGTGGSHFVVCREGSGSGTHLDRRSGGHVMKLRYTPLQLDVLAVESPESPHHEIMASSTSLEGMPVVCCGLHSQVPLVAAALKRAMPAAKVAYCMTDHAALPLALSQLVRASAEAGLLDTTVTCGQAFGGSLEAVNLHSGLLAARHVCGADVAIVAIGPGVVGTSTPLGHGGVAQGEALNAVAAIEGRPVACLRVSFADARQRHRGVSHHTMTALTLIALARVTVAVPSLAGQLSDAITRQLVEGGVAARHTMVTSPEGGVDAPSLRGVEVRTMGRGPGDDPSFFAAAYAAGEIASRMALGVL